MPEPLQIYLEDIMSYRSLGSDFYSDCSSREYAFDKASGYSSTPGGTPCPSGKEVVIEQTGKECRTGQSPCKWVCTFRVSCQDKKPETVKLPDAPVNVTGQSGSSPGMFAAVAVAAVAAGAAVWYFSRRLSKMSYRSLGFLDVDAEARELASYAGQLMEEEMKARMPGIIASLQPNLNAAATKAVKASLQDAAIKEAIAGTQEKVATYALIGGLGIVLATAALTWYLVKD